MQASQQGWDLLESLCQLWPNLASRKELSCESLRYKVRLPDLEAVKREQAAENIASVVVGAFLNLIVCATESGDTLDRVEQLGALATAANAMSSWLRYSIHYTEANCKLQVKMH